jgi:copper chaperone NosL
MAGKDVCGFCKMPVAEIKFGAEIITVKGKIYKFDDMACMMRFLKSGLNSKEEIKTILAVSYANNDKFLNVAQSFFLKSPGLHTPMNSEIASFVSLEEAQKFLVDFPGDILTWNQVQQQIN